MSPCYDQLQAGHEWSTNKQKVFLTSARGSTGGVGQFAAVNLDLLINQISMSCDNLFGSDDQNTTIVGLL